MSNLEEAVSALVDSAARVLHRLVDLAPWHDETAKNDAHSDVESHVEALSELGRNLVPAGVVEQSETPQNKNTGTPDSFPQNPTE